MLTHIGVINVRGEAVTADVCEERVLSSVRKILEVSTLCSIATVSPDNRAHINIAYAAYTEDLRLCFLSHPIAQHCRNLDSNASMAISIYQSAQQWGGPDRGLQLFGTSCVAPGPDTERAAQVYGQRFPIYRQWTASLTEEDPGREYRLYWFSTARLKVSDESEFGNGMFVTATVQR
jgi:uncharacterized protein YhbP (UPF0306 family)